MGDAKRRRELAKAARANQDLVEVPRAELEKLVRRDQSQQLLIAKLQGEARDRVPTRRGTDLVTHAEVANMISNGVKSGLEQYTIALARRRYEGLWHRRLRRAISDRWRLFLARLRRPMPASTSTEASS